MTLDASGVVPAGSPWTWTAFQQAPLNPQPGSTTSAPQAVPVSVHAAQGGALSIGNFDGVHRGHQQVFSQLRDMARRIDGPAVVLTFDPHPLAILAPHANPPKLMTIEHRVEALLAAGADVVLVLPATPSLLNLSAEQFFEDLICRELRVRGLVEGPNFEFGRGRGGNVTRLAEWCSARNIQFEIAQVIALDGQFVSSSAIRSLISAGDVAAAHQLLGRPYRVSGRVVQGAQRGRTIGFPTANLEHHETLVPGAGVYGGETRLDGQPYRCAVHIGPLPTVGDDRPRVEVHLIDYAGDLYGQTLEVDLWQQVRGIMRFSDLTALQAQIAQDVQTIRQLIFRLR